MFGLHCLHVQQDSESVPLVRRDININMCSTGAFIREVLVFMNTKKNEVETEFRYPMKNCRVHGLRFKTEDGDWQLMQTQEKMEAEKTYQQAVSQGHQAALGQQLNGDVFSIKVGRIQPSELVWIEVNVFSELDWADCYSYRHQITMFPPYEMKETDVTTYQSKVPKFASGELPYGVFLTVQFEDTAGFTADVIADEVQTGLQSTNNVLKVSRTQISGFKDVHLRMHPTEMKPLVRVTETETHMFFQVSCGHQPQDLGTAHLEKVETDDEHLKEVLKDYEVVDGPSAKEPFSKRVMFVVDGSGSMSGSAIQNAVKSLKIAIKQLPEGTRYAILVFGSNATGWGKPNMFYPPELQDQKQFLVEPYHEGIICDGCNSYPIKGTRYHQQNSNYDLCSHCFKALGKDESNYDSIEPCQKAEVETVSDSKWVVHNDDTFEKTCEWINANVKADYGGTEMSVAIDSVYDRFPSDGQNVLVMLTDAGIGPDQEKIIVTKASNHPVKPEIFCLGIGGGTSMSFLEKFSNVGRGLALHVSGSDDIKENTQRLLRCVTGHFLRNITFSAPQHFTNFTKKPVTSYFFGEPLNVFMAVEKSHFKGTELFHVVCNGSKVLSVPLGTFEPSVIDLETMFNMTYLEQLIKFPYEYRESTDPFDNPDIREANKTKLSKEEYRELVIGLGCQYNIVTPFTSAVIVRELESADGTKTLEKVDIPVGINSEKEVTQYNSVLLSAGSSHMRSFGLASTRGTRSAMPMAACAMSAPTLCLDAAEESDEDMGCDFDGFGGGCFGKADGLEEQCEIIPLSANTTFVNKEKSIKLQSKYEPMTTSELVEELVFKQKSDGSWVFHQELLEKLITNTLDEYVALVEQYQGTKVAQEILMTLLSLAYFANHPEEFTTYNKSQKQAESYCTGKVTDVNTLVLKLVQLGMK